MNVTGLMNGIGDIWRDMDAKNRLRAGYVVIALLIIATAWSALADRTAALERKRKARETVLKELMPLKAVFQAAKQSSDVLAGRVATVRPDDSPARIIEETGIKGKGVKVTPLKGDERGGYVEDAAEVRIDGLTSNEMVNLLYRLEKGSRPLVLKRANLKVRFDDPSRFDISLGVALLKPAPAGSPK